MNRLIPALLSTLAISAALAADVQPAAVDICAYGASIVATPAVNAKAINAAIAAAAKTGGGKVVVPQGLFVTGTVRMQSNVELHLAEGAVLKGSVSRDDYNRDDEFPENFHSEAEEWSGGHLILGVGLENIAITGAGRIDGSGQAFFPQYPDYGNLFPCYKYGCKLHTIDREWFRPGPLFGLFRCRGIRIADITIVDTPCWTVHIRCSRDIEIDGVKIFADRTIANSDGLSIDCCSNVKIRRCDLRTGDDGIALRASCALHAATNICENIDIADCDIRSCCFGVRIGIGSGFIRKVKIDNCRVHESAGAFGFTPAWIEGGKNVYIEDVSISNCNGVDVECIAVFQNPQSDARIRNIKFENCRFAALLPSTSWGGNRQCMPENVSFVNCRRDFLRRSPVCHSALWERAQGIRTFDFWQQSGDVKNITFKNCRPDPEPHGVLLLSFDDRNFADWVAAMPVFAKYDAHATFYVSGDIAGPAVRDLKKIAAAGHSLGLHGYRHLNAPERVDEVGVDQWYREEIALPHRQAHVAWLLDFITFAYPNGRSTDAIDVWLTNAGWERVRGCSPIRPYDPDGKWLQSNAGRIKPLADEDGAFVPYREMSSRRRYDSVLLGEAYNTDIDEVCAAIRRAGERKEVLALSSHSIRPGAKGIDLKTEWLERMLATAEKAGVVVEGIDYFRRPDSFK